MPTAVLRVGAGLFIPGLGANTVGETRADNQIFSLPVSRVRAGLFICWLGANTVGETRPYNCFF
jgi:hypothetical protein